MCIWCFKKSNDKISEVHNFVQELIKQCKSKILHLEVDRTKLSNKLVGLKFNMED